MAGRNFSVHRNTYRPFYFIKLNVTIKMVINRQLNPVKKIISAAFSYLDDFAVTLRIDRKDKILLHIKSMVATEVHSSMNVVPLNFNTFKDVNTRKQMPSKLADVFKICGALLFLSFISPVVVQITPAY